MQFIISNFDFFCLGHVFPVASGQHPRQISWRQCFEVPEGFREGKRDSNRVRMLTDSTFMAVSLSWTLGLNVVL